MSSYSGQRVDDQVADLEVQDDISDQRDVHEDTHLMTFLRTGRIPCIVDAKERDRVVQRARRYRLEGRHVLRVWDDGRVRIVPSVA